MKSRRKLSLASLALATRFALATGSGSSAGRGTLLAGLVDEVLVDVGDDTTLGD